MGGDKVIRRERREVKFKPLQPGFVLPTHNLAGLLEQLGIKLFVRERSLSQYVCWSVKANIFRVLELAGEATKEEIVEATVLSEIGADSLLGVLSSLKLLSRSQDGRYRLSEIASDYLLASTHYYIGDQIEAAGLPMPASYLRNSSTLLSFIRMKLLALLPSIRYGSMSRLANQHARNLWACATAVRTGEFAGVSMMIDIAGGSGTFVLPLALDYPDMRVVLTDLPAALEGSRVFIEAHGLSPRVELRGVDALKVPWDIPEGDGMFMGNFLHGFDDSVCLAMLREAQRCLAVGGRLWIFEMIWAETRDGPLMTALYHAAMRGAGPGRQRSGSELSLLLEQAGFSDIRVRLVSEPYALVSGSKRVT